MKLVSIPANPVPENAIVTSLATPDGVTLRCVRWPPPAGRKGTVCVFQGRGEFIEKYFEVVRDLQARGFAVAMIDWRGQGLSDRLRGNRNKGYVRDYAQYDTDIATFMRDIVLPDCPAPFFALAHSMGAAVLLRAARRGERWFDRMVMTAPLLQLAEIPFRGFAPQIARAMRYIGMGSRYIPGGTGRSLYLRPFAGNPFTSDPVRYARTVAMLEAEPALGIGAPTIAWVDATFRALAQFAEPGFAAMIRQPIMMLAAGRDRIVSTAAIEDFGSHLRAGSHLIVAGSQHEIMMEQDQYREQFFAAFDAFVPGTPLFR
jgi:lysophospholipase